MNELMRAKLDGSRRRRRSKKVVVFDVRCPPPDFVLGSHTASRSVLVGCWTVDVSTDSDVDGFQGRKLTWVWHAPGKLQLPSFTQHNRPGACSAHSRAHKTTTVCMMFGYISDILYSDTIQVSGRRRTQL